ncbi:Unknown protein [Striga hermonthica]|uniref:BED-type domain-containing protein n=1 Tax=Striga hermonthica TaxID=68872 RepID=A0A9N7MMR1_STRHE|nr:Unknown protein [Striga hermonthica]
MDSTSSGQQTGSIENSLQSSVRQKTDMAWDYFRENVAEDGKKSWTCLLCSGTWRGGGITRMKRHLAGIKGDIAPCKSVPYDIRYKVEQSLKETTARSLDARSFFDDHSVDMGEQNHPEKDQALPIAASTQRGKRKRNEASSQYFAPRTTPGSQVSIKSAFVSKEALHNADMAIARFCYATCIPINAANSPYFQKMIDAMTSIGPDLDKVTNDVEELPDVEVELLEKGDNGDFEFEFEGRNGGMHNLHDD